MQTAAVCFSLNNSLLMPDSLAQKEIKMNAADNTFCLCAVLVDVLAEKSSQSLGLCSPEETVECFSL